MTLILRRSSLVAQVADAVRREILRGVWREWIPSERDLSQALHVSRNTCRKALQILRHEALIEPVLGQGIRINRPAVRKAHSASRHLHSVGIIIPEMMSRMYPRHSLLVDELRHELFDLGVRVELHVGPAYYRRKPRLALERLIEKNHHDCWIPLLSHEPLQKWFVKEKIPCVVSGSAYAGVVLPSVDLDYRAICRHAAGKLIALGHRRIVFFNRRSRAAGDLESEVGFAEGVHISSHPQIEARTVYHNDSRENITYLVDHLFGSSAPPTGLLIASSYCYLSVASALARRGFRIPADVSLISRDDDQFLSYVDPEPARYLNDVGIIVRKIMFLLRPILEGGSVKFDPVRIVPRFASGGSCQAV